MSDFASRFEKCERAIEQLRGELDALQSVMHRHLDDIITASAFADGSMISSCRYRRPLIARCLQISQAQTEAGFASLRRASTAAVALSERKEDEPPKLN